MIQLIRFILHPLILIPILLYGFFVGWISYSIGKSYEKTTIPPSCQCLEPALHTEDCP